MTKSKLNPRDRWHVNNLLNDIYKMHKAYNLDDGQIVEQLAYDGLTQHDLAIALVTVACDFNWKIT